MTEGSPVVVLGGTFDPIHLGHIKLALDLIERFKVCKVRLLPDFQPVHRNAPTAASHQRREMLERVVEDNKQLVIDDRELRRKGPSYTLLSLQELREEIGADRPIYFVLGADAFSHFDQWYQWRELLTYSHFVVAGRPGQHVSYSKQLQVFVDQHIHTSTELPTTAYGKILFIKNALLDISSSDIRRRIAEKQSCENLLPEKIIQYIEKHGLYQ